MQYIFFICGFKNSTLFNSIVSSGELGALSSCAEVLLESRVYVSLEECEYEFAETMQKICFDENAVGSDRHILIGRSNEGIAEIKSNINNLIDQSILYTYFVANESSLSKSSLKYNVFGSIKTIAE